MNANNLRVIKNSEIDSNLLKQVVMFDRTIFPADEEYSFPDGYLEKLYATYKDGLFVLLDDSAVVGYCNCIFISEEIKKAYLETKDYLMLNNIGLHTGNNNMYLYTLTIDEKYRHTNAIKILMQQFCIWLKQEKQNGKNITSCISEAVSNNGINSLLSMGMLPIDVDESGLEIYYSPDCLSNYIESMTRMGIEHEDR